MKNQWKLVLATLLCVVILPSFASAVQINTTLFLEDEADSPISDFCAVFEGPENGTLCTSGDVIETLLEEGLYNITVNASGYVDNTREINISERLPLVGEAYHNGGSASVSTTSSGTLFTYNSDTYPYTVELNRQSAIPEMRLTNGSTSTGCVSGSGIGWAGGGDDRVCDNSGVELLSGWLEFYVWITFLNSTDIELYTAETANGTRMLNYSGPADFHTGQVNVYTTSSLSRFRAVGVDYGTSVEFVMSEQLAPNVTVPVISPSPLVREENNLTASTNYSDPEADDGTVLFEFYVNGVNVVNETVNATDGETVQAVLTNSNYVTNDDVYVNVTANDGAEDSETVMSATVEIANNLVQWEVDYFQSPSGVRTAIVDGKVYLIQNELSSPDVIAIFNESDGLFIRNITLAGASNWDGTWYNDYEVFGFEQSVGFFTVVNRSDLDDQRNVTLENHAGEWQLAVDNNYVYGCLATEITRWDINDGSDQGTLTLLNPAEDWCGGLQVDNNGIWAVGNDGDTLFTTLFHIDPETFTVIDEVNTSSIEISTQFFGQDFTMSNNYVYIYDTSLGDTNPLPMATSMYRYDKNTLTEEFLYNLSDVAPTVADSSEMHCTAYLDDENIACFARGGTAGQVVFVYNVVDQNFSLPVTDISDVSPLSGTIWVDHENNSNVMVTTDAISGNNPSMYDFGFTTSVVEYAPPPVPGVEDIFFTVVDVSTSEYLDNFCVDIIDTLGTETLCTSGLNITANRTENTIINVTMYPQVAGAFYNVTKNDVNVSQQVTDEPLFFNGGNASETTTGSQSSWDSMSFSYEQNYPYTLVWGVSSWGIGTVKMATTNGSTPTCSGGDCGEVPQADRGEFIGANFPSSPFISDNAGTTIASGLDTGEQSYWLTYVNETYVRIYSGDVSFNDPILTDDVTKSLVYEGAISTHTGTKNVYTQNRNSGSQRNFFAGIVEGTSVVFQTKMFPQVTDMTFIGTEDVVVFQDDMESGTVTDKWAKVTSIGGTPFSYSSDQAYTGSQSLFLDGVATTRGVRTRDTLLQNLTFPVSASGAFFYGGGTEFSNNPAAALGFAPEAYQEVSIGSNIDGTERRVLAMGGFHNPGTGVFVWHRPNQSQIGDEIDTGVDAISGEWYPFNITFVNRTHAIVYLNDTLVYDGIMDMRYDDDFRLSMMVGNNDWYLDDVIINGMNFSLGASTTAVWNETGTSAVVRWNDNVVTGSYEVRDGAEILASGELSDRWIGFDINGRSIGANTITVYVNETFDSQIGEGQNDSELNVSKLTEPSAVLPSGTTVSTVLFNSSWTAATGGIGSIVYDVLLEIGGANTSIVNDTLLQTQEVNNSVESTGMMYVRAQDDWFTTEYIASVAPFTVNFVQNLTDVVCPALTFPNELNTPSIANIPVNFTITKEGGLSSPDVNVSLSFGGNTFYHNSCSESVVSGVESDFNCTVPMQFYYGPGDYSINVTVVDNGDTVTQIESGVCEYGSLVASQREVDTVSFSGAGPGISNVMGDPNVTIRNTGNVLFNLSLTAYDLEGRTLPNDELLASYFEAGQSLPLAVQLSDGVETDLDMSVANGANEVGQIGLWLSMPSDATPQEYFTPSAWQLIATG